MFYEPDVSKLHCLCILKWFYDLPTQLEVDARSVYTGVAVMACQLKISIVLI